MAMKNILKLSMAASLLLLVCSCSKREEMIIASELRLPEMFSDWEMPMYLYKTSYSQENWDWLIRKGAIEGFEHEYGYEYRIIAKYHKGRKPGKDEIIDNPTDYYVLIKVLSKEKKHSENLPGKRSPYLDYGGENENGEAETGPEM